LALQEVSISLMENFIGVHVLAYLINHRSGPVHKMASGAAAAWSGLSSFQSALAALESKGAAAAALAAADGGTGAPPPSTVAIASLASQE
jgi:hypothetical protein